MLEFKIRKMRLKFLPQAVDAEVAVVDVGVVEDDNAAVGKFRPPGVKIVADGIVVVQAVQMEEVDGAILKLTDGIIKSGAKKGGEFLIQWIMMGTKVRENMFIIGAALSVAEPHVDGGAGGIEAEHIDGLA